ncbi:Omega-amino acid--pyruvate aminotransferase [Candidatus Burkholderia pumila]|uniref:Omega-amino acid--pyruvate aminotransferase n=1 Tax=Candidatus Burkholderia pumila TaxID=1090375 RepID=A0ABR5HKN9_9BURK|nr:Omega-amino acid--pyruvate aminotransferase [Candidatus Burkholderia pumila]
MIVEPLAGPTDVLVPPKGYLQKLREICTKHGILLIFDEFITGFGRLGKATASEFFGVPLDLITMAKAINNATIMGAVAAQRFVHDTIVDAGRGQCHRTSWLYVLGASGGHGLRPSPRSICTSATSCSIARRRRRRSSRAPCTRCAMRLT